MDITRALDFDLATIRSIEEELDAAAGPGHPASNIMPGTLSPHEAVIAAKDGYFFISNGNNQWENQYLGRLTGLDVWADDWVELFATRSRTAAERGVQLINFVVPEKQVIIPHMRWPDAVEEGQNRPIRHLQAKLSPNLNFIYPERELRDALAVGPTHHRHDSHWNASGCCIALAPLLAEISPNLGEGDFQLRAQLENGALDLTKHLFVDPPAEEYLRLVPSGKFVADNQNFEKTGKHAGSVYALENLGAPDARKVIVFGDSYSYGEGMVFLLSAAFRSVVFVWSKNIIWDFVSSQQADIVIWEHAERYLVSLPEH